jgi:ribosomal 50S subunit-associated protein YjgA (DUF615 family)
MKQAADPAPVAETPDKFQKRQAAKIVNMWQHLKESGGTLVENGKHTIPLVCEEHPEYKPR